MVKPVSILPPNHTALEAVLERVVRLTAPDLSPVATLFDPNACPVELLGWLAWSLSVDVWDPEWDEATKRRVIQHALEVHRKKGTAKSVVLALEAIGLTTEIIEGWEENRAPHSFRVTAYGEDVFEAGLQLNPALAEAVARQIENVKPARSNYSLRIGQTLRTKLEIRSGAAGRQHVKETIAAQTAARVSQSKLQTSAASCGVQKLSLPIQAKTAPRVSRAVLCTRAQTLGRQVVNFACNFKSQEAPNAA